MGMTHKNQPSVAVFLKLQPSHCHTQLNKNNSTNITIIYNYLKIIPHTPSSPGLWELDRTQARRDNQPSPCIVLLLRPSLVNTMCDHMNRTCYEKKPQWHFALMPFISWSMDWLLRKILYNPLGVWGSMTILVQCIFWLDRQPDIVEKPKKYDWSNALFQLQVAYCANSTLVKVVQSQYNAGPN